MINLRDIELVNKYIGDDSQENKWIEGQNALLNKIFDIIKTTNKYYVEFGYRKRLDTTDNLRINNNWKGLLLGISDDDDESINFHKHHLTIENILDIFNIYNVPKEFDFICIDTDWNDWYFLYKILTKYSPRCIMIEINHVFKYDEDRIILYEDGSEKNIVRPSNGSVYQGCSLKSILNLCSNYSLIYVNADKSDAFLVRNDIEGRKQFVNYGYNEKIYNQLPGSGVNNNYYFVNQYYKYDKFSKLFIKLFKKCNNKNLFLTRYTTRPRDALKRPYIPSELLLNNNKIYITDLIYVDKELNEIKFKNNEEKEIYCKNHSEYNNTISLINYINNIFKNKEI